MWLIVGTVPEPSFPLHMEGIQEDSRISNNSLVLPGNLSLAISRGTTALAATAIETSLALEIPLPRLLLAGDCGTGDGSMAIYDWLAHNILDISSKTPISGISFHYIYPDLDGHNKLFAAMEELNPKPLLVADAGFMYVAKMSGYARNYDLFTPDAGELAFLADEKAPHPFYTRGFLLAKNEDVQELVRRAQHYGNCPANMIIKGQTDYILYDDEIIDKISSPAVEAMECIGGTGDMVTGFVSAYLARGDTMDKAALRAVKSTRYLGHFCQPSPASQASELISEIGSMLKMYRKIIEEQ